jgi:5-methylcytosine-specific restriction endonuclease McrA
MSRRRFSEREVIETLIRQGVQIACYRCGVNLYPVDAEREHVVEIALGGKDDPTNCVYSHKECHAIITNGTPATTAGSSKHRIAKTRGTRAEKFAVVKRPLDEPPPEKSGWRKPFNGPPVRR